MTTEAAEHVSIAAPSQAGATVPAVREGATPRS